MPFMYCNHAGCNETVQLPNKYCPKHTPNKAAVKLDVDKVSKSMNTKKTTK